MFAFFDKAFLFGFSLTSSQPTPVFYPSSQYASKRVDKYGQFESNYLLLPAYCFTVVKKKEFWGEPQQLTMRWKLSLEGIYLGQRRKIIFGRP